VIFKEKREKKKSSQQQFIQLPQPHARKSFFSSKKYFRKQLQYQSQIETDVLARRNRDVFLS
jgi:hypothetical protein